MDNKVVPHLEIEHTPLADGDRKPDNFSDIPQECVCPYCHEVIVTRVDYQSGWLTFVLCLLTFMVFGWFSICILPFLYPLFQAICHYCPLCQNRISKQYRIKLPTVSKEVMTVKCGNCAIVLSRKYVIFLGVMTILIVVANVLRWYIKNVSLPDISKGKHIDATWKEFVTDCGYRSYLGNPLHASSVFDNKYYQATVQWNGEVHSVREGIFSKNFISINMVPTQSPLGIRQQPDLSLMFGSQLNPKVANITVGNHVDFEATLLQLGKRGRPHLGILWDLNITNTYENEPISMIDGIRSGNLGLFDVARELTKIKPKIRFVRIVHMGPNAMESKIVSNSVDNNSLKFDDQTDDDDVFGGDSFKLIDQIMESVINSVRNNTNGIIEPVAAQ